MSDLQSPPDLNSPMERLWQNELIERLHEIIQEDQKGEESNHCPTPSSSSTTLCNSEDQFVTSGHHDKSKAKARLPIYHNFNERQERRLAWIQQYAENARDAYFQKMGLKLPPQLARPATTQFNPLAAPYVPVTACALLVTVDAPAVGQMEPCPLQIRHPWIAKVRSGTSAKDQIYRDSCSRAVVNKGPWDVVTMTDLGIKICERASQGYGPELDTVAPFVRSLIEDFGDEDNKSMATAFRTQFRYCITAEFHAWWQSVRSIFTQQTDC